MPGDQRQDNDDHHQGNGELVRVPRIPRTSWGRIQPSLPCRFQRLAGGDGHDKGMAIPAQRSHQGGRQEDLTYHQNMHERRERLQGSPRGDDEHPIQRPRGDIPSTNIPPRTRPEAQTPRGERVDSRNGATPSGKVGLGMCINTTCTPPPQQQQAFNTDKEPTFRYFQLGRIPGCNPKPEYEALRSRSRRTNVTSESRCAGYVTKGTPLLVIDQRPSSAPHGVTCLKHQAVARTFYRQRSNRSQTAGLFAEYFAGLARQG